MRFASQAAGAVVAPAAGQLVHRKKDEHPGDAEQDET
jgi:hypothetical protein